MLPGEPFGDLLPREPLSLEHYCALRDAGRPALFGRPAAGCEEIGVEALQVPAVEVCEPHVAEVGDHVHPHVPVVGGPG